jgi:5-methylcytosine-specific restriction endonuclease McrA
MCRLDKLLSEFSRDATRKDGLSYTCKACQRVLNQANYKKRKRRAYHSDRRARRSSERPFEDIIAHQNRRAALAGAQGELRAVDFFLLCRQYGFRCLRCGGLFGLSLTPDHVIPLVKGGANVIENIQPLCLSCNSSKGDDIVDYRSLS